YKAESSAHHEPQGGNFCRESAAGIPAPSTRQGSAMNRRLTRACAAVAAVLVLTGCTSEPLGASTGEVTAASDTVVFDRSPTRFGDGLVAVRYPGTQSAELTFVVTDGEQQWEARTNP